MQEVKTRQELINFIMQSAKKKKGFNDRLAKACWKLEGIQEEHVGVVVDTEERSVEYYVVHSSDVIKGNILNAVIATNYINKNTASPRHLGGTFIVDKDNMLVAYRHKFYYNEKQLSCGYIGSQITKVAEAFRNYDLDIGFLLMTNDVNGFKEDLEFPERAKVNKWEGKEKCFENGKKALEKYFSLVGDFNHIVMIRLPLERGNGEKFPLTLSLTLRKEDSTATMEITHTIPVGFDLQRGVEVAMATNYLNTIIGHGRFNIDIYTGKASYRFSMDLERMILEEEDFDRIYGLVSQTLSKYYPTYAQYISGVISTEEFINYMEVK